VVARLNPTQPSPKGGGRNRATTEKHAADIFFNEESLKHQPLIIAGLLVAFVLVSGQSSLGQSRPTNFQGEWEWVIYPTSRKELPPAYRNEPLKSVPVANVWLKLKQRGNKLTGEYGASAHYLARVEDGELDETLKGLTTTLELTSGFGGTVTVRLTLQGNRLHWKTIKSDGVHYFPDDVFLHRVIKRKKRH
jgi:hypothetical protein